MIQDNRNTVSYSAVNSVRNATDNNGKPAYNGNFISPGGIPIYSVYFETTYSDNGVVWNLGEGVSARVSFSSSDPISLKIRRVWNLLHAKSCLVVKLSGVVPKYPLWPGLPRRV
ncbi:hypothetical protein AVEN_104127-1 [Araneus ventricosus]|uniref:Uncharacterized protein n=1 Tax=Araneus ventricosus TaxID=182803 RepID=A0A4Y2K2X4_ARAVE|nr:hypothetical protein AVEN_104127-1 [Araneus ventricosus]